MYWKEQSLRGYDDGYPVENKLKRFKVNINNHFSSVVVYVYLDVDVEFIYLVCKVSEFSASVNLVMKRKEENSDTKLPTHDISVHLRWYRLSKCTMKCKKYFICDVDNKQNNLYWYNLN